MRRAAVIIVSLALLVVGLVTTGTVATGTDPSFVGSWQLTITDPSAPPGQQTAPALATIFADGTFLAGDLPVTPAPPGAPFKLFFHSAGHGAWAETGPGTADLTFLELNTNEAGVLVGTVTVSASATLDASGDAMSGVFAGSAVGPDGQPVASFAGTFTGTRIQVEPMASPAASPSG